MKRVIIFLVRAGISGGILYFIFSRSDLNFQEIVRVVREMEQRSFYLAIMAYGVVLLLASLRWKVLLDAHQIRLTLPRIWQLSFIGLFFNNFLPSLTGGDIVKAYYVSKETPRRAEAVMTVIADRWIGWLSLFFLGAGAGFLNLGQPKMRGPVLMVLLVFAVSLILTFLAFNGGILKKDSRTGRGNPKPSRLREGLRKLHRTFYFYKSRPRVLVQTFFLSLLLQTLIVVINYRIALGLGARDIGITYFFLFIPIVSAVSAIPVSVAGWGVGEITYKEYFSYVGLAGEISVSLSLILRLMLLAWSLVGLPLYLLHRHHKRKEVL